MSSIRTLLVIEDNPGDARLLREMLAGDRTQRDELIHVGSTMIDAETHLARHAVDVVLLDLGLPDAQGVAAIRRIRAAAPDVRLGHVWTAPWQELSDVFAALVGCGHVSGLLMRQVRPLALMLCADQVPNKLTHFG